VSGLNLTIDHEALVPLIRIVISEALAELEADRAKVGDRLCYSEQEAAQLLGVKENVLRDERRRGKIEASQIVGRRIRYTREDLLRYLASRRIASNGNYGQAEADKRRKLRERQLRERV
jgi:excisionase family DNA binding protein